MDHNHEGSGGSKPSAPTRKELRNKIASLFHFHKKTKKVGRLIAFLPDQRKVVIPRLISCLDFEPSDGMNFGLQGVGGGVGCNSLNVGPKGDLAHNSHGFRGDSGR